MGSGSGSCLSPMSQHRDTRRASTLPNPCSRLEACSYLLSKIERSSPPAQNGFSQSKESSIFHHGPRTVFVFLANFLTTKRAGKSARLRCCGYLTFPVVCVQLTIRFIATFSVPQPVIITFIPWGRHSGLRLLNIPIGRRFTPLSYHARADWFRRSAHN